MQTNRGHRRKASRADSLQYDCFKRCPTYRSRRIMLPLLICLCFLMLPGRLRGTSRNHAFFPRKRKARWCPRLPTRSKIPVQRKDARSLAQALFRTAGPGRDPAPRARSWQPAAAARNLSRHDGACPARRSRRAAVRDERRRWRVHTIAPTSAKLRSTVGLPSVGRVLITGSHRGEFKTCQPSESPADAKPWPIRAGGSSRLCRRSAISPFWSFQMKVSPG